MHTCGILVELFGTCVAVVPSIVDDDEVIDGGTGSIAIDLGPLAMEIHLQFGTGTRDAHVQ